MWLLIHAGIKVKTMLVKGDTGGGCMAAATARCRCAWRKFRENLPLLTSKPVPFDLRGRLFSSNVRSSMLHGTETWPMTSASLHRLCRNDRAMIRWICGVKPSDDPSMDELHAKLGICDLAILVRERRLRWFGHVMRSNGEINRVRSRPVPGRKGPGRPKKTWEECLKQDLEVCGLSEAGTQDRLSWRSSVKNSRQEPTPSNGSLPQSMAAPPARRVLEMRTRFFNKTGFDWLIDWLIDELIQLLWPSPLYLARRNGGSHCKPVVSPRHRLYHSPLHQHSDKAVPPCPWLQKTWRIGSICFF